MCAGVLGEDRSATASVASLVSDLSSSVSCGLEGMMAVEVRSWIVFVDVEGCGSKKGCFMS